MSLLKAKLMLKLTRLISQLYLFMKKVFLTLLPLAFFSIIFTQKAFASHEILFFWGDGCPHCKAVIEQIGERGLDQQLTIEFLEVYNNRDNSELLTQKARECEFSDDRLGVPFLYLDGACYMGEVDTLAALEALNPDDYKDVEHTETVLAESTSSGTETSSGTDTSLPEVDKESDFDKDKDKVSKDIIVLGILLGGVGIGFLLFAILTKKNG